MHRNRDRAFVYIRLKVAWLVESAAHISHQAFQNGLIAETCGEHNHVLKTMPPLTIDDSSLRSSLNILNTSIQKVFSKKSF